MSLFRDEQEHAANPPTSWIVTKLADRCWALQTADGATLETATTKHAAETLKTSGPAFTLYETERRWMAGETIPGWRPYADVVSDRDRDAAWLAEVTHQRRYAK